MIAFLKFSEALFLPPHHPLTLKNHSIGRPHFFPLLCSNPQSVKCHYICDVIINRGNTFAYRHFIAYVSASWDDGNPISRIPYSFRWLAMSHQISQAAWKRPVCHWWTHLSHNTHHHLNKHCRPFKRSNVYSADIKKVDARPSTFLDDCLAFMGLFWWIFSSLPPRLLCL